MKTIEEQAKISGEEILVFGYMESELYERDSKPSWHVCIWEADIEAWTVTSAVYYAVHVIDPIKFAYLPE